MNSSDSLSEAIRLLAPGAVERAIEFPITERTSLAHERSFKASTPFECMSEVSESILGGEGTHDETERARFYTEGVRYTDKSYGSLGSGHFSFLLEFSADPDAATEKLIRTITSACVADRRSRYRECVVDEHINVKPYRARAEMLEIFCRDYAPSFASVRAQFENALVTDLGRLLIAYSEANAPFSEQQLRLPLATL